MSATHSGLNFWGDVSIVPAAARTTTTTGDAVDLGAHNGCVVWVATGTVTDGSYAVSLTECATVGGSYTAVAAADIIPGSTGSGANGAVFDTTAAHDQAMFFFGYRGVMEFIKVVVTASGSPSTGAVYAAGVVGYLSPHMPVTTP